MGGQDGTLELIGLRRRYGDGAERQPSAGTPAIEVRHLTKDFGDRVAFHDVSFEICRAVEVGGQWAVPWLAPHSAATIPRGEWPTTAGRGIDGDDLVIVAMDDPGRVSGISA